MKFTQQEIDEGIQYGNSEIQRLDSNINKLKMIKQRSLKENILLLELKFNRDLTQATIDKLKTIKPGEEIEG